MMKPNHSEGFTLLEVLVSLSLLALLLLSLEASQLFIVQNRLNSYHTHLALRQIRNMEERLHMLKGQGDTLLQESAWNQENQNLLPRGKGELSGSYPDYHIKLCWGQKNQENKEGGGRCLSESFTLSC